MVTCYCRRFYRIDDQGQHWVAAHPDLESRVARAKNAAESKRIVRSMIEELEVNPDKVRWIRTSTYSTRTLELTRQFLYNAPAAQADGDDDDLEWDGEAE